MKKTSFRWIYVKFSLVMCFVVASVCFAIFIFSIETTMNFPQLIEIFFLATGVSVLIGAIVGMFVSIQVNKPIRNMTRSLSEIERGNYSKLSTDGTFREFSTLESQIAKLTSKSEEQSLMMQQKTSEYAEEKQNIFEEAIAVERGRLARELHDSVSQQLFAISMMSSAIYAGVPEEGPLKEQLSKLEYMSIQAQSEMRALLLHLRPIQLEGKKLSVGINELLTELSAKQNLDVRWHIDDLEFDRGVEDHLFRILQEAISNTLRHAKASKLEISLKQADTVAIMRIFDNGIGFNKDDRTVGSYGLETMKERAQEIGGALKIMSIKEAGTQIEIKIPIRTQKKEGDYLGKD